MCVYGALRKLQKHLKNASCLVFTATAFFASNILVGENAYEQETNTAFPKKEYEYYMNLAQRVHPVAYIKLKKCEIASKTPCIKKMEDIDFEPGSEKTRGYPILGFNSMLADAVQTQKGLLKMYLEWYNSLEVVSPITADERQNILKALKSIDSTVHEAIVAADSTGAQHIKRSYVAGASIMPSPIDGLPLISVDAALANSSIEDLRVVLAHELSHYVLGHFYEDYTLSHAGLEATPNNQTQLLIKGKRTSSQLPFKETFEKARSRVEENEADKFAIISFGIDINDAIALAKKELSSAGENEMENMSRKTFQKTHPFWSKRIEYLESLRPEVELNTMRKIDKEPINWQKLAAEYLQKMKKA